MSAGQIRALHVKWATYRVLYVSSNSSGVIVWERYSLSTLVSCVNELMASLNSLHGSIRHSAPFVTGMPMRSGLRALLLTLVFYIARRS